MMLSTLPLLCTVLPTLAVAAGFAFFAVTLYANVGLVKALTVTAVTLVSFVLAALLLPLIIGVWLPDILLGQQRVLAEQTLPTDQTYRVVQYWNYVDFYTTELRVLNADGSRQRCIIDGDDNLHFAADLALGDAPAAASRPVTVSYRREEIDVVSLGLGIDLLGRAPADRCLRQAVN